MNPWYPHIHNHVQCDCLTSSEEILENLTFLSASDKWLHDSCQAEASLFIERISKTEAIQSAPYIQRISHILLCLWTLFKHPKHDQAVVFSLNIHNFIQLIWDLKLLRQTMDTSKMSLCSVSVLLPWNPKSPHHKKCLLSHMYFWFHLPFPFPSSI